MLNVTIKISKSKIYTKKAKKNIRLLYIEIRQNKSIYSTIGVNKNNYIIFIKFES